MSALIAGAADVSPPIVRKRSMTRIVTTAALILAASGAGLYAKS